MHKSKNKNNFFSTLSSGEVKTLRTIIKKCLKGEIPVTKQKLAKLSTYKTPMRKIARIKPNDVGQTRRVLRQTGWGLFSIILPAALSLLTGLISRKK